VEQAGAAISGMHPLLAVVLLTALPVFELRASIPYGYFSGLPMWQVLSLAIAVNWLIAPLIYLVLKFCLKRLLGWKWFAGVWERYSQRVMARTEKAMQSWGAWGLAVFIGVPLPGSGVYTGAIGAYLLGMRLRTFLWVSLVGVVIAAIAVTLICVTGNEALSWMIKPPM
jgi:uncharacterized membrane protein